MRINKSRNWTLQLYWLFIITRQVAWSKCQFIACCIAVWDCHKRNFSELSSPGRSQVVPPLSSGSCDRWFVLDRSYAVVFFAYKPNQQPSFVLLPKQDEEFFWQRLRTPSADLFPPFRLTCIWVSSTCFLWLYFCRSGLGLGSVAVFWVSVELLPLLSLRKGDGLVVLPDDGRRETTRRPRASTPVTTTNSSKRPES